MIRCPICLHDFNAKERIPKIFPCCGHTICKECLTQILKSGRLQCPLDKLNFSSNFKNADAFITNILAKDLLEISNLQSRCPTHNEPKKLICLTDNSSICSDCVLFGDHKDHDIMLLSDFDEAVQKKKKELTEISDKISKNLSQLNSSLEHRHQDITVLVKQRFQKLHAAIDQQQTDILDKLGATFAEEKSRLEIMVAKSLKTSFNIQRKLKEFSDIKEHSKIIKLTEEDSSDLKCLIDEEHMATLNRQTKDLSEIFLIFQNALPKEDLLKYLDILKPLTQDLMQYNEKRNSEHQKQLEDSLTISVPLSIEHQKEKGLLKIESFPVKISYTFTKSELEQVSEVRSKMWFNDEMVLNSTLPVLVALSNYLVNVKSIKIEAGSSFKFKNQEMAFYNLMLASFPHPENLKSITIKAPNLIVKDSGALYLFQNVIPKAKSLETFDCDLRNTAITNEVLIALTKAGFSAIPSLQKFKLNISCNNFNEGGIKEFLLTVPNAIELELDLSKTCLTDKVLDELSTNTLPSLNQIQTFKVDFSESKITDLGVKKLIENIPNASDVQIKLQSLQITDNSLQPLFDAKLSSLTNLQSLNIYVERTNVSRIFRQKLQDWRYYKEESKNNSQGDSLSNKLNDQFQKWTASLKTQPQLQTNIFSQPLPKSVPFSPQNNLFTSKPSSNLFSLKPPTTSLFSQPSPFLKSTENSSTTGAVPSKQRAFLDS